MKAFILAAGVSRRLYPETYKIPKCLLDVGGKPIIDHQLTALDSIGIKDVTVIVGYYREMLTDHLNKTFPNLNFNFIIKLSNLPHANFVEFFLFPQVRQRLT